MPLPLCISRNVLREITRSTGLRESNEGVVRILGNDFTNEIFDRSLTPREEKNAIFLTRSRKENVSPEGVN